MKLLVCIKHQCSLVGVLMHLAGSSSSGGGGSCYCHVFLVHRVACCRIGGGPTPKHTCNTRLLVKW